MGIHDHVFLSDDREYRMGGNFVGPKQTMKNSLKISADPQK